jgi:hypothetical protein
MIDYSKSKIYTIRSQSDTNLIYVGSTTQPLSKRWGEHKNDSKLCPLRKLYRVINGEWDDWYIELYQPYPCNNREELQQKEREIIRLIGNLNVRGAQPENVSEKPNDDINETKKEINDKYLEKQREYTRRSRAKDPDEKRRKGTEYQRMYRARVKVDSQAISRMPDNCNGYQEIQSITLPAGEVLCI